MRRRLLRDRPAELDCRDLAPEAVAGLLVRVRELIAEMSRVGKLPVPSDPRSALRTFEAWLAAAVDRVLQSERRRLNTEVEESRAQRITALGRRIASLRASRAASRLGR